MQKILILKARPSGLELDVEIRNIEEAIERTRLTEFTIHTQGAVRAKDIRRAIEKVKPTIVHFCGHGTPDGNLVVENEARGREPIFPEGLARLFDIHKNYVQCVLINTCYSEAAAEAVSKHIPYVVGMNREIDDRSAIAFSEGFYDGLGYDLNEHESIFERAFKEGLTAIDMGAPADASIPKLKKKADWISHSDTARVKVSKIRGSGGFPPSFLAFSACGLVMTTLLVLGFLKGSLRTSEEKTSPLPPASEISNASFDLSQLSVLLEEKKWKAADLKTEELLLIAADRYREGWLDRTSIDDLPCESIMAIDAVWESHTDGRFSFKKQSEIWHQISAKSPVYDKESYKNFAESIGWYSTVDGGWLSADQLRFSLTSPPGHLPSGGKLGVWMSGAQGTALLERCYP